MNFNPLVISNQVGVACPPLVPIFVGFNPCLAQLCGARTGGHKPARRWRPKAPT